MRDIDALAALLGELDPAEALSALAAALRGPQATEPTGSASSIDLREGE